MNSSKKKNKFVNFHVFPIMLNACYETDQRGNFINISWGVTAVSRSLLGILGQLQHRYFLK